VKAWKIFLGGPFEMDKVITGLIIALVIGFFYWLSQQEAEEWEAMVGMGDERHSAGTYSSYDACVEAVKEKVDVSTTSYSCSK